MLIKIKGRSEERFETTKNKIMNLACIVFRKGSLPSEEEIQNPEKHGEFWYENKKEDKFELLPVVNNHKAFIRDRGDNFIVVEFYCRYDINKKKANALSNLILTFFDEDEVELITN